MQVYLRTMDASLNPKERQKWPQNGSDIHRTSKKERKTVAKLKKSQFSYQNEYK